MRIAIIIVSLAIYATLNAAERGFDAFPNLGGDWVVADHGETTQGAFSWRHFRHSKTGDLIAFVAWHAPDLTIDNSSVRQASIEIVTSKGYAYASTHKLGQPITDTLRHRVVSVSACRHIAEQDTILSALEYSYIYESSNQDSATTIAHGYVIKIEDHIVFVQHTADRVISSEMAQSLVMDLAVGHMSIPDGWSASIKRSKE